MATSSNSANDGTIECCLQILQSNHAVLITNDTELYNKGTSAGIHTFKLDEIKQSIQKHPEVSFNLEINVPNQTENIFMQNADNFEPFPLSNGVASTQVKDSNVFKVPTTFRKKIHKCSEKNKVVNSKPAFGELNIVTDTSSSKKIKLIQNDNVKYNNLVDSNVVDDIKLLSLHDSRTQKKQLCDNLKGGRIIRKVTVTTSLQDSSYKDEENLNPGKKISEDRFLNRHKVLRNIPDEAAITEIGTRVKQNTNLLLNRESKLKINAYTLEDMLKRFHVKDADMGRRIESRLDELVCCYYQILEECLSDVLMNNTQRIQNKLSAPWTLLEAVLCLKEVYSNDTAIKTITDKLCTILSDLSDKNDNLKSKIKAADFMRLFGCGTLLVESLKNVLPQSAQVLESEKLLNKLFHHIQEPLRDIILPVPPVGVVRSEIDDIESLQRNCVLKTPAEIITYLKIHFPAWKDFDESNLLPETTNTQEHDRRNETTVVRTFGKNLNTIRISNLKKITLENNQENNTPDFKENFEVSVCNDLPRFTRTVEVIPKNAENGDVTTKRSNDLSKHTNIPQTGLNITKNIITDCKNWKDVEKDNDDYGHFELNKDNAEDIMVDIDDNAIPFANDKMKACDTVQSDGEISLNRNVNDKIIGDKNNNCNDSTNDSGYVNQSVDACAYIKLFLTELSASFKLIYTFIEDSIQEFRCNLVELKEKKVLYDKTNETHLYVADIIGKLKRIIDREANANTKLKSLIINAGVEALTDKRMTRYRQVIMKCLEQAQLLEGALKTMLALTNEHCDITIVDVDGGACHVPYFNIFE